MKWTDQESKIRDRLTQRKITPSANVWDQLESQLEEKQKTAPNKVWWSIAAGFLVGIGVAALFFIQREPSSPNGLVDESTPVEVLPTQKPDSDAAEEFAVGPRIIEKSTLNADVGEQPIENDALETTPAANSGLVQEDSTENSIENIAKPTPFNEEIKADAKTSQTRSIAATGQVEDKPEKAHEEWNEAVAGVLEKAQEKGQTGTVSDEEIDRLIYEAQLRYKAESALRSSANTVDANLLLQEVELEMDQPLKERIFKAIKEQWEKAKTAVASNTR